MKVYYLKNVDLGWDDVVSIATSPQKCLEEYTDGEIMLETDEEVDKYLESNKNLRIDYRTLKE